MPYVETKSLEDSLPDLDVLYMTRVQQERFADKAEYERLKDSYVLNREKLNKAKKDTIVLHPLPRVNEISVDVDDDPRACYFKQVLNGKYMRMALILKLLAEAKADPKRADRFAGVKFAPAACLCANPKCITRTEQELPQRFVLTETGKKRCVYCDWESKE